MDTGHSSIHGDLPPLSHGAACWPLGYVPTGLAVSGRLVGPYLWSRSGPWLVLVSFFFLGVRWRGFFFFFSLLGSRSGLIRCDGVDAGLDRPLARYQSGVASARLLGRISSGGLRLPERCFTVQNYAVHGTYSAQVESTPYFPGRQCNSIPQSASDRVASLARRRPPLDLDRSDQHRAEMAARLGSPSRPPRRCGVSAGGAGGPGLSGNRSQLDGT